MDLNQLVKNLHNGDSATGLKLDRNILWFEELSLEDISLVGEKNATLGEMTSKLSKLGVNVPSGFAITSHAYFYFLEQTGLKDTISNLLLDLDISNLHNIDTRAKKIRATIQDAEFPELLKLQISRALYR
jgi:pyruvate,water dikinase